MKNILTGEAALDAAKERGLPNQQQLDNLASYLEHSPEFKYGHVTAAQLRALGRVLDQIEAGDDRSDVRILRLLELQGYAIYDRDIARNNWETLRRINNDLLQQLEEKDAIIRELQSHPAIHVSNTPEQGGVVFVVGRVVSPDQVIGVTPEQALEMAVAMDSEEEGPESLDELLAPTLQEKFDAAVDFLGAMTTPEIANYFKEHGIKGRRYSDCECPVANYIKLTTGVDFPRVNRYIISISEDGCRVHTYTPRHVCDFIVAFDSDAYPELDSSRDA